MNIFVFELVTGGGVGAHPLVPALAREGDMMLRALLDDLRQLPDLGVTASRDPRLPPLGGVRTIAPSPGEDAFALYARGIANADAAWPIAPETDGALERLARATLASRKVLLGCRPDAVRVAASKRATARALQRAGVPAVPTFGKGDRLPSLPGAWVVKPDDGAGCDGVLRVPDWRAAGDRLAGDHGRLVAQPWIEGDALSLSLVCREGRARLVSCNRQHIHLVHGRPALEAITVNAVPDGAGRLADLGRRIAAAIPGLWGYVGVDLVLAEQGPVVLEVNPRLTTSYCGLRRALGINVAELVLDLPWAPGEESSLAPPQGMAATVSLGEDHGG